MKQSKDKAVEYQQVAGLLCLDIDLMADCCNESDMTKEEILWHVNDLVKKKNLYTTNKEEREKQYTLTAMLFNIPKG